MREVPLVVGIVNMGALDAAIRAALGNVFFGLSSYGDGRPVVAWMDDAALPDDDDMAVHYAVTHDPVFLSVDKPTIQANGLDTATVTVVAPNVNAAPVTLLINSQVVPMTLVNGSGTVQIVSLDPCPIWVTVQSPANRTTDRLEILAV